MSATDMNRDKALGAQHKAAPHGADIDLAAYTGIAEEHPSIPKLTDLSTEVKDQAMGSGMDSDAKERSGSFFQMDGSVIFTSAEESGLEVLSITEALEKYDGLREYWWRAVSVDADKFTAQAELGLQNGYFIRARKGAKITFPVQACLYLNQEMFSQNVHNIILAEEDSELHIITGCTTGKGVQSGLHIGVSEFYVARNAKISFSMIHNWAENVAVRPRSGIIVEEGGVFLSNYICMKPVRTLQMYPTAYLNGKGAVARFNSVLLAKAGSSMDVGSRVFLNAPESRAEVIARAVSTGGDVISRGHLAGNAPNIKAHLECRGLILREEGRILAIPELEGTLPNIEMSHEAALGRIAEEEIQYLMARGMTAEEATAIIVRGFLDIKIKGLPERLGEEIRAAIQLAADEERLY